MNKFLITGSGSGIGKEIALELGKRESKSHFYLVGGRRLDKLEETASKLIGDNNVEVIGGNLFENNNNLRNRISDILKGDDYIIVIHSAAIMIDTILNLDDRKKSFYLQNKFISFLSKEINNYGNKLVHISSSNVSLSEDLKKHILLRFIIKKNIKDFKYRAMKIIQEDIIKRKLGKDFIIIRPGFTNTDFVYSSNSSDIEEIFNKYIRNLKIAKIISPSMKIPIQKHIFSPQEIAKEVVEIVSSGNFKEKFIYEII